MVERVLINSKPIIYSAPIVYGEDYPDTDYTPLHNAKDLSKETMLFSADYDFAMKNSGDITKEILNKLIRHIPAKTPDDDYPYLTIDTRVHMLMPGMYPAIPGWHCDFTPRNKKGQPELKKISEKQFNIAVFVSSKKKLSRTEYFDSGGHTYINTWDKNAVWGSIDKLINNLYEQNYLNTVLVKEGQIVQFSGQTLHRATPAKKRGWRLFVRCSYKQEKPENEIRRQTQVYMLDSIGW